MLCWFFRSQGPWFVPLVIENVDDVVLWMKIIFILYLFGYLHEPLGVGLRSVALVLHLLCLSVCFLCFVIKRVGGTLCCF